MESDGDGTYSPTRGDAARRRQASREMQAYAEGDDGAFPRLYALVAPALWGFLARRVGCRAAAEDVMQQTLLHMHRARGRFRPGADVFPWMFTIAARLVVDRHRQQQRRPASARPGEALVDGAPGPEARVAAGQLEARLHAAVDRLPERQRAAFTLVRADGLSHRQAAEALGTSPPAIKSLIHRALRALRGVYRDADGGPR